MVGMMNNFANLQSKDCNEKNKGDNMTTSAIKVSPNEEEFQMENEIETKLM